MNALSSINLFEKEIDGWMADREYIGYPSSREELACNQIELFKISSRLSHDVGYPQDQKAREELWRQAIIEQIDYCYGRKMTDEDLTFDDQKWQQLREDMVAGKDASESEAALYLRDLFECYPRKSGLSKYLPVEEAKY